MNRRTGSCVVFPLLLCGAVSCGRPPSSPVSNPGGGTEPSSNIAPLPPDEARVTLTGVVTDAGPGGFFLDYGAGMIFVEMDDFDFYPEGRNLLEGDHVIVQGAKGRQSPGDRHPG